MKLYVTRPLHCLDPIVFSLTCLLPPRCLALTGGLSIYLFIMWQRGHRVFGQLLSLNTEGVGHCLCDFFFFFWHHFLGYITLHCVCQCSLPALPPFSCYFKKSSSETPVRPGVVIHLYLAFPEKILYKRGNNSALSPLLHTPQLG